MPDITSERTLVNSQTHGGFIYNYPRPVTRRMLRAQMCVDPLDMRNASSHFPHARRVPVNDAVLPKADPAMQAQAMP